MGNCGPKIMECLNDVNDFLENRCGHCCEPKCKHYHSHPHCCCDEENLFTPCRPTQKPCCHSCCNSCCHCNACCNPDDYENVYMPYPDKREDYFNHCSNPCSSSCCTNNFEHIFRCMIGKKVRLAIGSKCGTVCILGVEGKYIRAMVVGSGKIVMINMDQITQFREIC